MFVHIGGDFMIEANNIVAIMDFDNVTGERRTLNLLKNAEKEGRIVNIDYDLPRTMILVNDNHFNYVYLTPISVKQIEKRINNFFVQDD